MLLLATMSMPKPDLTTEAEWHLFDRARIEILDWERKECIKSVDYITSPEHLGEGCSMKFTGGCLYRGQWFQAAGTELVIFNLPDWSVDRVISHRSFNDLHGVTVIESPTPSR